MVKLVFVEGLLFTSVCDALGKELKQGYSLIIVVLIGLVIIFKTRITGVVNDIFEKIVSQSSSV